AADAALDRGLSLAMPGGFTMALPGELAASAERLAQTPEVGGVLVCHAPAATPDTDALTGLAEAGRAAPILVCAMGETTGAPLRRAIADAGLPVFPMPVQAVAGFHHLVRDRRNRAAARELPTSRVLLIAPDKAMVGRLFDTARRDNRLSLMQDEALDVLAAYGIPIVPTRRIESPDDAAVAAALLGFPAVVKLRQAVPPQECARGGLALDLPDAVSCAVAARVVIVRTRHEASADHTLLVQRQAARAEEFTIHVADDRTFGPVIGVNLRGVADSARHEPALDLPPLNLTLARALIGRGAVGQSVIRSAARDRPPVDPAALAETLVRISQLLVDFPDIAELQVSSLFADDQGAIAADAWLRLRAAGEPAARLAIAPYPVELEEEWKLGEEKLIVRPIRPEDAEAHAVLFNRLSPQDIRFRFFAALRSLSPEQMARLTQVDYDREMAFIAVNPGTSETLGVARLVSDVEQRIGEFAVIVRPDMKGRGLATHLMQRLIAWARRRRLTEIVGQVLSENVPMLAFVRNMGFTVTRMPDEPEVMEVRLPL
ncbi:MAG TPA: GNAT family N-acetyltransferase, partial [Acetobacteraceae bacterium]|nr:GNAT family N-acetyltransferase [Acetobacteraceae bacterium]